MDNTNNLSIGVSKALHMARLVVVFTSFNAIILPLEESGEVEQRNCHVCTFSVSPGGDVVVVHKAALHKAYHYQTSSR